MGYILTDTSPAYELVGDITVSSATTSVSFTGLNFTSADDLLLVSEGKNDLGSYSDYYLYVNGNTTQTNYWNQAMAVSGTTITTSKNNKPFYAFVDNSSKNSVVTNIKLTNSGYFVYQANSNRLVGSSSTELNKNYVTSTFTASSITSLTISAQFTNAIGTGSRFRLYKLVAEKVADITVSTATTSVNITGLSIDKGSEYMLVADFLNDNLSASTPRLYINNSNVDANYYNQYLYADGTSKSSGRENTATFTWVQSGSNAKRTLTYANIKLTNNGTYISQATSNFMYGYLSTSLLNNNITSTFTATSITQLTITASVTNGIGVGSRFQLYKLR